MERLVKVVSIDEEFEKARTRGAKDIKKRKRGAKVRKIRREDIIPRYGRVF